MVSGRVSPVSGKRAENRDGIMDGLCQVTRDPHPGMWGDGFIVVSSTSGPDPLYLGFCNQVYSDSSWNEQSSKFYYSQILNADKQSTSAMITKIIQRVDEKRQTCAIVSSGDE
jgi:hypothetical protein